MSTIGELYGPAMTITTQEEADAYFEKLVEGMIEFVKEGMLYVPDFDPRNCREQAIGVVRQNLGYYAGYYDEETNQRVQRLFRCSHPIFGTTTPTPEEAFQAGMDWAAKNKDE